jgi:zinc transporter, ZIP family
LTNILLYSLIAGLATTLGGGIVLLFGRPRPRTLAALLGAAAGIMFAVVVYDLLPSAADYGGLPAVVIGSVLGITLLFRLDLLFAARFRGQGGGSKTVRFRKMGYLIATGIALHDLPEGIAIAAGYAATENLGLLIALAIGLHNIPEGMATAAPLVMAGEGNRRIVLINLLVSLFTPLGTLLGLLLVHISPGLIAVLLALAAGAMTYISLGELIPETRRMDPFAGGLGLAGGFLLILLLNLRH